MIYSALTSVIESAFNTWLSLDSQSHGQTQARLQQLAGKLICLHITNPDVQLYFLPTTDKVRVTTHYDAIPDVTITGSALALMRLSTSEDSGKTMLSQGIQIDGDVGLGTKFSHILKDVDIDWEELLSKFVGDVIAHQMGQRTRQAKGWLADTSHAMRLNTQEYLQEESKVLPAEAELRHYLDQVDELRMDADRLEARIQRLEKPANA